ncbi:MAG TPA: sigma-70 family RNA polymerase sigma factor [Urbifossiella sp.]|nr:sigma-70 family RNA polymerase sigma factor [Urbifossiella sp.]
MSRSLLHLVLHHAEGFATPLAEPDSELLARFVRTRDEAAFAELLRRHASMVWAVCRQSLASDADAEDAFQATFLALIRSAKSVKDGRALAGWLHGVAVRVALKRKRSAVRQRQRERLVAAKEADRPVPEAAWNALLAAVHEEVQRLPDSWRTAFVMCELEGVRQAEAAERLGWKPGTLTGRLARARQALIERLGRRGLAPAVGGSLGLGLATATAEAPHRLIDTVMSLIPAGGVVSPALVKLASEGLPMLMRTKLAAAVLVVAGGLSAVLFPMANAQVGGGGTGPAIPTASAVPAPPAAPGKPLPPRATTPAVNPGGFPTTPPLPRPPGTPELAPNRPPDAAPQDREMAARAQTRQQWEYKFVVGGFDTKDPFGVLASMGAEGWEYCGSLSMEDNQVKSTKINYPGGIDVLSWKWKADNTLIFKRSKVSVRPSMPMGMAGTMQPGASTNLATRPPFIAMPANTLPTTRPSLPETRIPAHVPPAAIQEPSLTTIRLRNAEAAEIAQILEKVFSRDAPEVTAIVRTNSLIIRADDKTLQEMKKLLLELDTPLPALPTVRPASPTPSNQSR